MRSDQLTGKPFQKIRPLERTPNVSQQVAEHLTRLIASGTLAPGEKLPGEVLLAERLGVSRPTLREALSLLRSKGLVEIRARSGTYVAESVPQQGGQLVKSILSLDPAHVWELLEVRRILEPEIAALAARRSTPADVARLRELLGRVVGLSGEEIVRYTDGARVYGRFFYLLAGASHNALFSHLSEALAGMLRDALAYSRLQLVDRPDAGTAMRDQLIALLDAVEAGEEATARTTTRRHLEFVERTLKQIEAERAGGAA